MSQKKETTVLVLSLIITLGILGAVWWLYDSHKKNANQSVSNQISFGEKSLVTGTGEVPPAKLAGLESIAAKKYDKAISDLSAYIKANPNDPEALIFLNNARIVNQKNYTIAVLVPIGGNNLNVSLEILRGVAQSQNEINQAGGIQGIPLKVEIANDNNQPEIAEQIAEYLVKQPEVLGVVGPFSSDVTLAAGKIFQSGELVAITPTSTSVKLSGFSRYVFRTVPSDYVAARALADYMLTKLQRKNAAVFFNSQSAYSQSLKSEFVTAVSLGGGQVQSEFDLSNSNFSAANSVEQAIKQGVQVLMLAPETNTLDKALQIIQVNRKSLTLLGGDDIYTLKTLQIGGDAAVGMVVAVPWDINTNPNLDFVRSSRELWKSDVNWRTALAYDATRALIAAIGRNPQRTSIQQTLSSPDFSTTGASGTVKFLPSGDRNGTVQLVTIVPGNRSRSGYDFVPVLKKQ